MAAYLSKDTGLMKAAQEGRDIYSSIAAIAFNTSYENCCEFNPDGTKNLEGKARRTQAKTIVLGILYGRGIAALAQQLQTTKAGAQKVYDDVLKVFTGLKKFKYDSEEMTRTKGYVTTAWGRRRRLPDMQLPSFNIYASQSRIDSNIPLSQNEIDYFTNQMNSAKNFDERMSIINEAKNLGILIQDNNSTIARATRQCVNARVQGSAADMTKIAMVTIANDEELKSYGFRMLIQVHDEIIGECPEENADKAAKRFAYLMSHCVEEKIPFSFKTDVEKTYHWYADAVPDFKDYSVQSEDII